MKPRKTVAIISQISVKANRFIVQELEKRGIHGIVPSHGSILYCLSQQEKMTMKELATKIHKTKPTVTVLIDKLVGLGYVYKGKCDVDSRVTYITLSEKGKDFKKDFEEISQSLNSHIFQGISEEEIDVVEPVLQRVLQNLL